MAARAASPLTADEVTAIRVAGFRAIRRRHALSREDLAAATNLAPERIGQDATVVTSCGYCAEPIELAIQRGQPPKGSRAIAWMPGGPCSNAIEDFCPSANLFCDRAHLDAWRRQHHDPPGTPCSLSRLASLGQAWAGLRHPAARAHPLADWRRAGRRLVAHWRTNKLASGDLQPSAAVYLSHERP